MSHGTRNAPAQTQGLLGLGGDSIDFGDHDDHRFVPLGQVIMSMKSHSRSMRNSMDGLLVLA